MSEPARAAVRPMVVGRGGPAIPLESAVERMLRAKATGLVMLSGVAGSGLSTALNHLRAVFAGETGIQFHDQFPSHDTIQALDRQLLVITSTLGPLDTTANSGKSTAQRQPPPRIRLLDSFLLAPWGRDELIEYTLARHPEMSRSILARALRPDNARFMGGSPLLATVVLDAFAAEPTEESAQSVVRLFLSRAAPDHACQYEFELVAFNFMFGGNPSSLLLKLRDLIKDGRAIQLLHVPAVQARIVADRVVSDLSLHESMEYLSRPFKPLLIRVVSDELKSNQAAYDRLVYLIQENVDMKWHGTMAAILVAVGQGWKPTSSNTLDLCGAKLSGAAWPQARLGKCKLDEADLSSADLREAELKDACLLRANLSGANLEQAILNNAHLHAADLRGARLVRTAAEGARFCDADLTSADVDGAQLHGAWLNNANLTRTRFVRANLYGATLKGATLDDTDFTGACLENADLSGLDLRSAEFHGAVLAEAYLARSRLDGQHMPGVNLRKANLSQADLTGSCLSHADLSGADLRGAGLAEIEWERADLSGADLRNCSFHAGSSRSGLVDSVIASEGTRTGFYTDEYDEQLYRPVEEIRKANLRGADLRGANVEHTDFYLVDLRDAKYDAEQEAHFRRCGAILETRV